jgi:PglZ domain-containing protein
VPHAQPVARPVVEELCERLRSDRRTQALYIARAEKIENELSLPLRCEQIVDLGVRDTFPFEERSLFTQAVDALKRDNVDRLRELLGRHTGSIWVGRGESQAQWQLLKAAASLIEACEDADRQIQEHARGQDTLIDLYIGSVREVDRLQREFEEAADDPTLEGGQLTEVKNRARTTYQRLANRLQSMFIRQLEKTGWPPMGHPSNADVFDKIVAPRLQESGRRIALLLIDALRYELGVELQKHLVDDGQVDLQAAFAQLPSVTHVGMASLLPSAGQTLRLAKKGSEVVSMLGDQLLTNVDQRMDVLRRRYGQRFAEVGLNVFVRAKYDPPATTELLVIRSNEMDSEFESNPEAAPSLITRTFQRISAAVHKLRSLGFQEAIILTDHGFYLNMALEAGDVCSKPAGTWTNVHDRLLLGDGTGDAANALFSTEALSIRGEYRQVALPRAMVAYRAGQRYFHGGASLQEAIVPVITVRLQPLETKLGQQPTVTLSYKRGAKRITTRLPVLEIEVGSGDLFSRDTPIDMLVQAYDRPGNVVGEAKPGDAVNAATKLVTVKPGQTIQVPLKMNVDFEGKFTIKALDPSTLATFGKLDLETDYTV